MSATALFNLTSHEGSEIQGVARFAEMLAAAFSEVDFRFQSDSRVWTIL
jgi:hypothetical protein